jgi:hypothetical protein
MYDKPELFDDYVSQGGHDYRPDLRLAVFKWINKYLKNDTGPIKDADFKPIAGKDLRVFPEDSDLPKDAINGKIDETFVPKAEVKLPERGKFEEWKKKLLTDLREHSFRSLPQNVPVATYVKGGEFHTVVVLSTEANIQVVSVDNSSTADNEKMPRIIVLNSGDLTTGPAFPTWAKEIVPANRSPILCLWTRGLHGYTSWTHKSPPNTVERSLALIRQTVEAGRVHDVIATCQGDKDDPLHGRKVSVIGRRQAGVIAAYAALFEPNITEVVIVDPPVSHRDGPIFLNVLRVLDIPEALGLLAPRPLTLINAKDKAFDRTAEIYKLAGAADKFQRK